MAIPAIDKLITTAARRDYGHTNDLQVNNLDKNNETLAKRGFVFIEPAGGDGFNPFGNTICLGYDDMGNIIEPTRSWMG